MKTIVSMLVAVTVSFAVSAQNAPLLRYPSISTQVFSNILHWVDIGNQFNYEMITEEGQGSDQYYSINQHLEMFTVYAPGLPGHGTILTFEPMVTDTNGIRAGFDVRCRDQINGTFFSIGITNNIGSFVLGGQTIWIKVSHDYAPQYPILQLTWGSGSSPGVTGDVTDDMSQVVLDLPLPKDPIVSILIAKDSPDLDDGTYIGNTAPEGKYVIQTSTNLVTWKDETNQSLGILGSTYYYQFPPSVGNKFYRSHLVP